MTAWDVRMTWNDSAEPTVRAAAAVGVNHAAERLYALVVPVTPRLGGDLERGYGIHQASGDTVEQGAQLQNSSPYARYQHEGGDARRTIRRWTHDPHPEAQAKFVSGPAEDHAQEFGLLIAEQIRQALQ